MMDPRDLELINKLLEGEANLKEVNHVFVLGCSSQIYALSFSYRGSASKQENLKRKRE